MRKASRHRSALSNRLANGDSGEKALSITGQKHSVPGSYVDLPGVYCLRSSQTQWTEEQLWRTLREIMSTQCRVTASFRRADGKALHVRKATRAEPEQMAIYRALKVNPAPEVSAKLLSKTLRLDSIFQDVVPHEDFIERIILFLNEY
jgi:hypothetical protein